MECNGSLDEPKPCLYRAITASASIIETKRIATDGFYC
jgi:hypothetical protein